MCIYNLYIYIHPDRKFLQSFKHINGSFCLSWATFSKSLGCLIFSWHRAQTLFREWSNETCRKSQSCKTHESDIYWVYPIGSMVLLYMVTWIPSIYPRHVSIYTSTMDPMGTGLCEHHDQILKDWKSHYKLSMNFALLDSDEHCKRHYPLVNVNKKLWKITMFNGKIHYFYGHFQ